MFVYALVWCIFAIKLQRLSGIYALVGLRQEFFKGYDSTENFFSRDRPYRKELFERQM